MIVAWSGAVQVSPIESVVRRVEIWTPDLPSQIFHRCSPGSTEQQRGHYLTAALLFSAVNIQPMFCRVLSARSP